MVKKLQKMADKKKAAASAGLPGGLLDGAMAQNVKDSAQQIWAAGLASFARAQGEGSKVFEALVAEGLKLQKKTQSAAEGKLNAVATKVTGMAGDVGAKAGQQWDKLETIFEERVAKALKSLNVPSASDVDGLIKRIDALAVSVGLKKAAPAEASAATKATARRPAVKKTAAAAKAVAAKKAPAARKAAAKTAAPVKAAAQKTAARTAAKAAPAKAAGKAVAKAAKPATPAAAKTVASKAAPAKTAAAAPAARKAAPARKAPAAKKAAAPAPAPAAADTAAQA